MTTTEPDTFTTRYRNPTVEAWVKSYGITEYDLVLLDFADIDEKESRGNQARFKPIDQDTVNRYSLAASSGAEFPPLVAVSGRNGYVVVDGNHRHAGLTLAGADRHPAYICDAPGAVVQLMTQTANTINGLALTPDEVRRLVLYLDSLGSLNAAQISLQSGMSKDKVKTLLTGEKARDRAHDDITTAKVSDHIATIIGRLHSDAPLKMLFALQASANAIHGADLTAAVKRINSEGNDTSRMRVTEDILRKAKGANAVVSKKKKRRDASPLKGHLTAIMGLNAVNVAMSSDDRQALIHQLSEASDKLTEFAAAL